MADDPKYIAAVVLSHALISNTGSRQKAAERADKAVSKYEHDGYGKALWSQVGKLLRGGAPLPAEYRRHVPQIPGRHDLCYVRVEGYASGGAVESKSTKEEANYTPFGTQEQHCSICSMWIEPKGDDHHGRCEAVRGDISPVALCDLFERRPK